MRRFYRQFMSAQSLCFDIGANHGRYSELFLSLGCRVVAVEPQKSCFDGLVARYGKTDRARFFRAAVGAEPGRAKLFLANIDEVSTLSTEFIRAYGQGGDGDGGVTWTGEAEDVDVTTLDDLIERHGLPVFCKIDIEGWETEALKGISRPLPAVSVEYVVRLKHRALECLTRLEELGQAEFNFSAYEEFRFRLPRWLRAPEFRAWLVALPPDVLHGDIFARL